MKKRTTSKKDIYQIITEQVVKGLESKGLDWFKSWADTGLAINHNSGRAYTSINQLFLSNAINDCGYSCNEFITFKKAGEMGGKVKKGATSHIVVYYLVSYYTIVDDKPVFTREETGAKGERKYLKPRYYRVFNLDDVEGLEPKHKQDDIIEGTIFEPRENADLIYTNMMKKPDLSHGGNKACYSRSNHSVRMPLQSSFVDSDSYYKVLFHELIHSTGHGDLLNRKTLVNSAGFGSTTYSKEELVAEMGCMFLVGILGLEPKDNKVNSQAYINGWVKQLKDHPKMILEASSQSQKAVEYILNNK
tara:strand:+ start:321 stop:1232 length:912 start_codon:yes stop_codon:yes gene_type:complete